MAVKKDPNLSNQNNRPNPIVRLIMDMLHHLYLESQAHPHHHPTSNILLKRAFALFFLS